MNHVVLYMDRTELKLPFECWKPLVSIFFRLACGGGGGGLRVCYTLYIFLTSVDFNLRSEIPFFRPAIASNCCPSYLKVSNRVKHPVNTLENRNDAGIWSLFRHQGTAFSWIKYQLSGAYENWSLLKRCTQHSILGTYLISQSLIILK